MKLIIFSVLVTLVLLGLLVYVAYTAAVSTRENEKLTISLEEGKYEWEVYSGGQRLIWFLAYENYDSLPISNNEYYATIVYQGVKYKLWRVYSNQIRVSPPIKSQEP